MHILIVEADLATARSMGALVKEAGLSATCTDLGEEGTDLARNYDYDLITLDLNMRDMHGLEVVKTIRAGKVQTPVMIVTGDSRMQMKLQAFKNGADDYLTKPFYKDELIARILAIVRRSRGYAHSEICVGTLVVNLDEKRAEVQGVPVPLTRKEYAIVELLALRQGCTITKESFLNHMYGGMDEPEFNAITTYMARVRFKLGASVHIETMRGQGYRVLATPGSC